MTGSDTKTPRQARRAASALRLLIVDAAAIEFEANGFGGATTAAIARRAAVTEAQLFRLFSSKEALFRAAIFEPLNHHFATFMAETVPSAGASVSRDEIAGRYTGELHDFVEQHSRMLMSLIVASSHGGRSASKLGDAGGITEYFDRGAALMASRLGEDKRDNAPIMVRIAFAAVLGTVLFNSWLFPITSVPKSRIRSLLVDFILHGTEVQPTHDRAA